MNDKNAEILRNTFPKVYPEQYPLAPLKRKMPFEFRCYDGWFNLIYDLSQKISSEIEKVAAQTGEQWEPIAIQVKEKDGRLRFYIKKITDTIVSAIGEATIISEATCEICGQPGIMRTKRIGRRDWSKVRCDDCWEEECRNE
ncbi:MAG: hypothetical protein H6Q69_951 [Firmicutes bacterium]|nr:hypothetical protein [Bacillota bacterium]